MRSGSLRPRSTTSPTGRPPRKIPGCITTAGRRIGTRETRFASVRTVQSADADDPLGYFCPDGAWAFELFGLALLAFGLLAS
jgi:hypothetical protein